MLTLYGVSPSPFTKKVLITLAEKQIPYEFKITPPHMTPDEYIDISPLRKVPAITDGNYHLCDSSAICAYLEKKHPKASLYPQDAETLGKAIWLEEYADSRLAMVTSGGVFFERVVKPNFLNQPTDTAKVEKTLTQDIHPVFTYLERVLGNKEFFTGEFSIVDIAIVPHLISLYHANAEIDGKRYPNLFRYYQNITKRPSIAGVLEMDRKAFGKS